jgi:hypothetical protein
VRVEGTQRRLFLFPHEAAVAEHVGTEYGGELAFHTHLLLLLDGDYRASSSQTQRRVASVHSFSSLEPD